MWCSYHRVFVTLLGITFKGAGGLLTQSVPWIIRLSLAIDNCCIFSVAMILIFIYLLTLIELTPGGSSTVQYSTHLHTKNT